MKKISIDNEKYNEAIDLLEEILRITIYAEKIDENFINKVSQDVQTSIELLDNGEEREIYRINKRKNEH